MPEDFPAWGKGILPVYTSNVWQSPLACNPQRPVRICSLKYPMVQWSTAANDGRAAAILLLKHIKPYGQHLVSPVTHVTDSKGMKELCLLAVLLHLRRLLQIQSLNSKPGDEHSQNKGSDCWNRMPLIFSRSRLTPVVEGKEVVGEARSIASKVESLAGTTKSHAGLFWEWTEWMEDLQVTCPQCSLSCR